MHDVESSETAAIAQPQRRDIARALVAAGVGVLGALSQALAPPIGAQRKKTRAEKKKGKGKAGPSGPAGTAGTIGPQGPPGPPGPAGAFSVSELTVISRLSPLHTILAGEGRTIPVSCKPGELLIGGSFAATHMGECTIQGAQIHPADPNQWIVTCFCPELPANTEARELQAIAFCLTVAAPARD
jgi:hypothetical protein